LQVSEKDALPPAPGFGFFTFQMLLVTGASAAIRLFQRWLKDTKRIHELETATIRSELEQLRNQISPHFLFNMLNNANVLTHKNPQKASEVLIKLSDILRYQLYDCVMPHVLLTSEIHFLNDFLNLENIRRDHFDFFISQEGNMDGIQLAPLLFITFVENAVKHNADPQNASYVYVYFSNINDKLIFQCVNSKPGFKIINSLQGGLGLVNVQRRLNLLYPERHTLVIHDEQDKYQVTLTIDL
jgi:LytS/YehU family sensor histidine kinase